MKQAPSEASLPRGFRFSATACGLKKTGALDLAMLSSDVPASAAAVFTQNLVVAAPVVVSKANLKASKGRMRAVIVNAGNANCATGAVGYAASVKTVEETARHLRCRPEEVAVCSTGVIGVPLPVEKILRALAGVTKNRRPSARSFAEFSLAICTTDTRPKTESASFKMGGKRIHMVGCSKGAGMIHPNMATTLAFVATDANISPSLLQKTLRDVTTRTFNAISIDGDTSTNDTLLVLANGAAGAPIIKAGSAALRAFAKALEEVCRSLALQIVADGEGAQRVIEIEVRGAKSENAARRIGQTIATSPLVKTAFAGGDPNWGRIFAAAGRAGVKFDPDRVDIHMAGIPVLRRGQPLDFNERAASNRLLEKSVHIVVNLHAGRAMARYWTCDFTAEYVRINASYRT
ncbi:MAG TPA: bifunctional glutamate N-acetyltransferase/amino-acid acetyltransferase ArgJ [Candidatus Acidoferrales bacterium]|jgi:glutamate N-acetyltransferase/amino-acid N-acetyltransferase|nr:bifunctional glutamate N-acetyltransferase/amino-acid acetyltransferase ArgJ [Candidatus Acidoferrales bacterium]